MARHIFLAIVFVLATSMATLRAARGEDSPYAPQQQASLQSMLSIQWKKGPSLPQGLQDSGVGIVNGALVDLGRRECGALELLLRRADRVVSKASIEEAIYAFGEELASNAIEVLIHRLRKRMHQAHAQLHIHTLRGIGYMLTQMPEGHDALSD